MRIGDLVVSWGAATEIQQTGPKGGDINFADRSIKDRRSHIRRRPSCGRSIHKSLAPSWINPGLTAGQVKLNGRGKPLKFPEMSAGTQATMATVITTLEDLIRDLDIEEPIGPDTRVVADLGFESIDLIQMVAALEQAFRPKRLSLVDMLVADGRYVNDLRVSEIVAGIENRIARHGD